MSIIHDALKKIQQSKDPQKDPQEDKKPVEQPLPWVDTSLKIETPPSITTQHYPPEPPRGGSKFKSILALMCAVLITYGGVWFIYKQLTKGLSSGHHLTQTPSVKPLASLTIPSAVANTSQPVTLNIQGVMANESGNVVLINDQIYQQGDIVDGAKIINIDLDAVTVFVDGKQKIIPVGK